MPSRTSILETLSKVTRDPPALRPKSTIGTFSTILFNMKQFLTGHPFLSVGIIIGVVVAATWLGRSRNRRAMLNGRAGFFQLPLTNEKEGMMGGVDSSGKTD